MWKHFGNIKASYCARKLSLISALYSHRSGIIDITCGCVHWIRESFSVSNSLLLYLFSCAFLCSQLWLNLLDCVCMRFLSQWSRSLEGSPVSPALKPVALNGIISSSSTNLQIQVCVVSLPGEGSSPDSPFSSLFLSIECSWLWHQIHPLGDGACH